MANIEGVEFEYAKDKTEAAMKKWYVLDNREKDEYKLMECTL